MTPLSDRQHDAFDNPAKLARGAGGLESRDDRGVQVCYHSRW